MSGILRRAGAKLGIFKERATAPSPLAGRAQIYAKANAGSSQIFMMDSTGVEQRIGSLGGSTLVYQPGGTPSENVYDDWTALMTAINNTAKPINLLFDDSQAGIAVPTGTSSMVGVSWGAVQGERDVIVTISAGASLPGLRRISGRLQVILASGGSTIPVSDLDDGDLLEILDGAVVESQDPDTALFKNADGTSMTMVLSGVLGGDGGEGGGPTITFLVGDSASLELDLRDGGFVEENCFEGDNNTNISVIDSGGRFEAEQTNFNGNITYTAQSTDRWNMVAADSDPWTPSQGDYTLIPTAPYVVDLPLLFAPFSNGRGVVVFLDANDNDTVTINAFAGNTINGAASLSLSRTGGFASVELVPFGTDWKVKSIRNT